MSSSGEAVKSSATVSIRFPKGLWLRVRRRALERGETGLSYLSRCAEVCLGVAEGVRTKESVTAGAVEPGSDVEMPVGMLKPLLNVTFESTKVSRETSPAALDVRDAVCACGHPMRSHHPKCLVKACGCLGWRKPPKESA